MQPYPPQPYAPQPPPRQGMSGCAIAGIVIGALGFVAILAVCGGMLFLGRGRVRDQARNDTLAQPTLPVEASVLIADFDANEVQANARYQGRRLELSGRIEKIATDLAGRPELILSAGHLIRRVQCHFGVSDLERFASLQKGQEVRVSGFCKGLFVHVQLEGCTLLEVLDENP